MWEQTSQSPRGGEADCENESVGGDFGQQGGALVFCRITPEDGRKFGEWRQTRQKKILATRCHQEPMGLKKLSAFPLKSRNPISLRYSHSRQ